MLSLLSMVIVALRAPDVVGLNCTVKVIEPLGEARSMLDDGNFYGVLRALRRLLPLEERLLDVSDGRMMVQ